MTANMRQLKDDLLTLPPAQRAFLAQELWQSLDVPLDEMSEQETYDEAYRRSAELADGTDPGFSHEEVMASLNSRLK